MPKILQIDDYVTKEIAKVKKYASEHIYGKEFIDKVLSGKSLPVGDNPEHVVHIHNGYRAVYSIYKENETLYHHLSISYEEEGKYPGIPDTQLIMEQFGMGNDVNNCTNVWLEEKAEAVNILKEFE